MGPHGVSPCGVLRLALSDCSIGHQRVLPGFTGFHFTRSHWVERGPSRASLDSGPHASLGTTRRAGASRAERAVEPCPGLQRLHVLTARNLSCESRPNSSCRSNVAPIMGPPETRRDTGATYRFRAGDGVLTALVALCMLNGLEQDEEK